MVERIQIGLTRLSSYPHEYKTFHQATNPSLLVNEMSQEEQDAKEQLLELEKQIYKLDMEKEQYVHNQDWDNAARLRDETDKLNPQRALIRKKYPEIAKAVLLERTQEELAREQEELARELEEKLQQGLVPRGTYAINANTLISIVNVCDDMPSGLTRCLLIACEIANQQAHRQGLAVTYKKQDRQGRAAGAYFASSHSITIYGNFNAATCIHNFNEVCWNRTPDERKKLAEVGVKEVQKMYHFIMVLLHELGHDCHHEIENLLSFNLKKEILDAWQLGVKRYYQGLIEKQDDKSSNLYDELELIIKNPDVIMIPVDDEENNIIEVSKDSSVQSDQCSFRFVPYRMYISSFKEIMAELYRLHCYEVNYQKYGHFSYQELIEKAGDREGVLQLFEDLYYILKSNVFENLDLLEKVRNNHGAKTFG